MMQRKNFEQFKQQLSEINNKNGMVLVDFGDHQPNVTRRFAETIEGENALKHFNSIAYLTCYNITPINMQLAVPNPKKL